jgi:hypothetical protein
MGVLGEVTLARRNYARVRYVATEENGPGTHQVPLIQVSSEVR